MSFLEKNALIAERDRVRKRLDELLVEVSTERERLAALENLLRLNYDWHDDQDWNTEAITKLAIAEWLPQIAVGEAITTRMFSDWLASRLGDFAPDQKIRNLVGGAFKLLKSSKFELIREDEKRKGKGRKATIYYKI